MSYEYHKHPKKNWGQPPAFRLPPADRTGSEKIDVPSSILNKRTIHVHMHQGGTGRYLFFSRPYSPFLSRKGTYVGFPFLHLLLQVSLDFRGGVFFCTASFSLRFNLPFFPSGSLSSHDLPQRGQEVGLVAKRTGTNSPDPRVWLDGVDRVVWSRVDWNVHSLTCTLSGVVVVDINVGTQDRHFPDGAAGWSRLALVQSRE